MRRFISTITAAAFVAAITLVVAPPVLGQNLVAGANDAASVSEPEQGTEGAFTDLVPVQECLLDDQGGIVFRVVNQGRGWPAPATTTSVTLSTGGAPFHIDLPTAPVPPGGYVDLALGIGPADLGASVVGFAVTADSTEQVGELNEANNTVGGACSDRASGASTLPGTGGLSPGWLYAMFGAAGVLVSAGFTAGIFGLRRVRED